jgi:cephalosporin hydroxylase
MNLKENDDGNHAPIRMINPNVYSSLYGLPMQQTWEDLVLWEWFLNRTQVQTIIELGTGSGAFSCFLITQCVSRGIKFVTVDIREPEFIDSELYRLLGFEKHFHVLDLSLPKARPFVHGMIKASGSKHPVLLYCDNGDKAHEVAAFGPLLDRGDYLGVHDFGIEFHDHDLEPVRDRVVELVKPDKALGRTRWYEVIK